jgi:hypothetical protein
MEHPGRIFGIVLTLAIPALMSFTFVGQRVYVVRRGAAVAIWMVFTAAALLQILLLILAGARSTG